MIETTTRNETVDSIIQEIQKVIIGQEYLIQRLLVGLICGQHVLIEGVPGLAKTLSINTLAKTINADFSRIQFTPDLLPSDLIGTQIYNPKTGEFTPRKGPVFANIILADEINRAPAKVQSALLEAMQERQVTLGDKSYELSEPFMVLATQNPVEQEGTYPLPEAQVDRFMLKLKIDYPSKQEELQILRSRGLNKEEPEIKQIASYGDLFDMRKGADSVFIDPSLEEYIVDIVHATRNPGEYGLDIDGLIQYGASPRATIFLSQGAKALAFLNGRDWVSPEDIKSIGMDVLRHRIIVSYEAEAEEKSSEDLLGYIFNNIKLP